MGSFSTEDSQRTQTAGSQLVQRLGGLAPAARQIQLIRFHELKYAMDFIERTHHLYPDTSGGIMSIYTHGAMRKYYPDPPPKSVPVEGYPRKATHTAENAESMWEDIAHLAAFICETTSLSFGERSEYSPATSVPKRLPYRTFSTKSRTISDLRRINLGIDTEYVCLIW